MTRLLDITGALELSTSTVLPHEHERRVLALALADHPGTRARPQHRVPGRVGCQAPQRRVDVGPTGRLGPHALPVYTDETGDLLVEITPEGMALPVGGVVLLRAHPVAAS
ncbi:DUF6296 family protein [Kitasatospora sp. MBT63]|uniref:DUF6296 family protein n=1 Tax=Kitasatospora sp. MBT63 TaxID=1444768 RepID=UPI000539DB68|nr:DUF6296 family protein [Kitasatospora sp. MBT63]